MAHELQLSFASNHGSGGFMRILIADTHRLFQETLIEFLTKADPDLVVTGVDDPSALTQKIQEFESDIIILDDRLTGQISMLPEDALTGRKLITLIPLDHVQDYTSAKNLIKTSLPKTIPAKIILSCIYRLREGEDVSIDADIYADHKPTQSQRRSFSSFHLTQREKQVLSFLAKSASNKDISRALDLQVVTVKLHVRSLCRKIGAKNRTQAALMAHENDWIKE
jgi:two-component system, NarL family, nitrate/nitrite response regulator NarL